MSSSYVSALSAKRTEVLSAIERLREDAAQLAAQISLKENQLRNLDDLLAVENGRVPDSSQRDSAPKERRSTSFTDQAAEMLDQQGKPIHYRQLVSLLAERNIYVPGKDPGANLIAHISRDARFARVGRGMYGLAGWPSVRSTTRKPKRKSSTGKRVRRA
jgi:hypothetical protein